MKTKPSTEYALLGSLMSGPRHGYDIQQFFNARFGSTWYIGTSQLYALLKRLEENGLLRSSMEAQNTRPSKRIFFLTEKGKNGFLHWLNSPCEHVRDIRIEFLAKLFFFNQLSMDGGEGLIEEQIKVLKKMKREVIKRRKKEHDPFNALVIESKSNLLNAWLGWLNKHAKEFIRNKISVL